MIGLIDSPHSQITLGFNTAGLTINSKTMFPSNRSTLRHTVRVLLISDICRVQMGTKEALSTVCLFRVLKTRLGAPRRKDMKQYSRY
jgi:hypothetical protein